MADEEDDLVLYTRWCEGDLEAGQTLFERHQESIYRFFVNKCSDAVDELVQETLLACIESRDRFRRDSSFRTYLFAIAKNVLYDHLRRIVRPTEPIEELSLERIETTARTRMARAQEHARLHAALRELPLEQQLLLELHYWEGLAADELAGVFAIEPTSARSRLSRARSALRERLGPDADLAP